MNKTLKFSPYFLAAVLTLNFTLGATTSSAADSARLGDEIVAADTLLYAAWTGDLSAVQGALATGIDPDHVYRHSPRTALNAAAYRGHLDVVNLLIEAGANVGLKKIGDGAPLIMAVRSGSVDVVKVLLSAQADPNVSSLGDGTALITACKSGNLEIVKLLVASGAQVNRHVKGDDTPLINAIKSGNAALVDYLIDAGADVNQHGDKDSTRGHSTPVSQAQLAGNQDILRRLEQSGAQR
jgi:ankyrin repeat protein